MKHLTSKRVLSTVVALALVGGGGAAIAASQGSSSSGNGFFASVARHLGISTQKLKDATKAAALDQVNADLKAGRLTQAQGDALKARINAGQFPPFGGPGFGFRGGPHGFGHHLSAAADYLGLSVEQLHEKLESGQTLAALAKAQDKSVDGLKQAMLADAQKNLDQAVKDGMLSRAQADAMFNRLKSDIDDIVNGNLPRFGRPGRFSGGPPEGAPFLAPAA